jgi:hypothetical protein
MPAFHLFVKQRSSGIQKQNPKHARIFQQGNWGSSPCTQPRPADLKGLGGAAVDFAVECRTATPIGHRAEPWRERWQSPRPPPIEKWQRSQVQGILNGIIEPGRAAPVYVISSLMYSPT